MHVQLLVRRLLIAFVLAVIAFASRAEYLSAQRKFRAIDRKQYRPGATVLISAAELNAYVQAELPQVAPTGIRAPHVELLGDNEATGSAKIDFLKLRSTREGKQPNWIVRQLLQGEHDVAITTRISSGRGTATVVLQRVEIAGVPITGGALDFLVRNYLIPNYPDAKIGRPFALHSRVERIEVTPQAARVIVR